MHGSAPLARSRPAITTRTTTCWYVSVRASVDVSVFVWVCICPSNCPHSCLLVACTYVCCDFGEWCELVVTLMMLLDDFVGWLMTTCYLCLHVQAQVKGSKYVRLFAPSESSGLYPRPPPLSNTSQVSLRLLAWVLQADLAGWLVGWLLGCLLPAWQCHAGGTVGRRHHPTTMMLTPTT